MVLRQYLSAYPCVLWAVLCAVAGMVWTPGALAADFGTPYLSQGLFSPHNMWQKEWVSCLRIDPVKHVVLRLEVQGSIQAAGHAPRATASPALI